MYCSRAFLILFLLFTAGFVGAVKVSTDERTAEQVDADEAAARKITAITLIRSSDSKDGLADSLTLRKDGKFHYVGKRNVARIGAYSGKIPASYFGDPFLVIAENYVALRRHSVSTGKPTQSVTPVTIKVERAGKMEEFTVWCPGLDRHLFAFEMSIRGLVADAQWKKSEK